jgi:hypothetical protein
MRESLVDDRGVLPVIWIGNNHHAAIIEVEPQE